MNPYFFLLLIINYLILYSSKGYSQELEYITKASYIEKFTRYCQWSSIQDTFRIGIYGDSPIEKPLNVMASKRKIKNKPVKILCSNKINELEDTNLIFFSVKMKSNVIEILNRLKSSSILLVGESEGFCKKGGHFNFFQNGNGTIYFEINPKTLKQHNISIDLYLLEIGYIIK